MKLPKIRRLQPTRDWIDRNGRYALFISLPFSSVLWVLTFYAVTNDLPDWIMYVLVFAVVPPLVLFTVFLFFLGAVTEMPPSKYAQANKELAEALDKLKGQE